MAGGLVALFDDVAVLARAAAASVDDIGAAAGRASVKAAGVVVDDTAVTPQYVHGLAAERELPIIRKIAMGSLRNKLLIILPAILLLSQFLPVPAHPDPHDRRRVPLLRGRGEDLAPAHRPPRRARRGRGGARTRRPSCPGPCAPTSSCRPRSWSSRSTRWPTEAFVSRAVILAIVAIGITVLVYGVVGLIVKMDDVGLYLSQRSGQARGRFGRGLVKGMPKLLSGLTVVGTAAMLWVGGHILLVGTDELGLHVLYDDGAPPRGGGARGHRCRWAVSWAGWSTPWAARCWASSSAALIVLVMSLTVHRRKKSAEGAAAAHWGPAQRGQ